MLLPQNRLLSWFAALLGLLAWSSTAGEYSNAQAQEVEIACPESISVAERNYTIGRFDEAIATITRCLEDGDYDEVQRKEALRILSLSFIAKDRTEEARDAIQHLLELVPDYEPDPDLDPPPFVDMVKDVRDKMAAAAVAEAKPEEVEEPPSVVVRDRPRDDPPPVVKTSQPARKRGIGRWLLVGGVAVAGGVAAAVLLGGSGDPATIGPPPPLPPIN